MQAVIVTGTSSGLGKAFFESFASDSVYLIAIARRFLPEQLEAAQKHPNRIFLVERDLRNIDQLPTADELSKLLADPAIEELLFINNAAVVEPIGSIGQLDAEQMIDHIKVNFLAAQLITNTLFSLPEISRMRVQVLNISSGAATKPKAGWAMYCAAKAGNEMFFNVLAAQYEGNPQVEVANVNPGVMDTQMQASIRSANEEQFPELARFVGFKEEGKLVLPETVAANILKQYRRGE
ncbi:SDR family NAD(P)-dependent oxidoreductase [Brevibacillus ginsengisoli]|uniref:SDR family NAD(P)-dependent oxidoreductase n=1 Tax=Brevibacillus ginsengisoli TaxID=363854 RepID=UPI003CF9FDBC